MTKIPIAGKNIETKIIGDYRKRTALMTDKPHLLTEQFIIENAEYSLGSPSPNWKAWIWENIILLAVAGVWPPEQYPHYFSAFWDIFCERKKSWDKVYLLFDTDNLPIQSEEFRVYTRENWADLLERDDFCLCITESSSMKRAIWKSVHRLLNVLSKIRLFKDYSSALKWIQEDRVHRNRSDGFRRRASITEKLNLEWVKNHAHIKLAGKDLLWSITACRNIIILEIQKYWSSKDIETYMNTVSGLPYLLLEEWNRIFLLFDVTLMEFDIKDAPRFLQANWLEFLDRDDTTTCIVHGKKLDRFLWRQLLRQIGKTDRVKVFPDCNSALQYIRKEMLAGAEDPR